MWYGAAIRGVFIAGLLAAGNGVGSSHAQNSRTIATELLFDATTKELRGDRGQANFEFTFAFTNSAPELVVIESVRTSCGCTIAKVPSLPWGIQSGGVGEFSVILDARGKRGTVTKAVYVNSSIGLSALTVRAVIEGGVGGAMGSDDRDRNQQIALADRSAVFRGECASCHARPAEGKTGPALYLAACGVCHESHIRASMVPDLKNLPHPTDRDHWIRWISFGRHGSLMPAFSEAEGGPLTDAQIDSLADYLTRTISKRRVPGDVSRSKNTGETAPTLSPTGIGAGTTNSATPPAGLAKSATPPPSPAVPARK